MAGAGAATTPGREIDAGAHLVLARAAEELFSNAHAGRYFGGLWFKVFTERGPC